MMTTAHASSTLRGDNAMTRLRHWSPTINSQASLQYITFVLIASAQHRSHLLVEQHANRCTASLPPYCRTAQSATHTHARFAKCPARVYFARGKVHIASEMLLLQLGDEAAIALDDRSKRRLCWGALLSERLPRPPRGG